MYVEDLKEKSEFFFQPSAEEKMLNRGRISKLNDMRKAEWKKTFHQHEQLREMKNVKNRHDDTSQENVPLSSFLIKTLTKNGHINVVSSSNC